MDQSGNPILLFAGPLTDLAEGRLAPADWLAWWSVHARNVESACFRISNPGWFLKLEPSKSDLGANGVTLISQRGACEILEALKLPFVRSDRYQQGWKEDFEKFRAAEKARKQLLVKQFEPRFSALAVSFPKFARFLKKRASDIDRLEEPATGQEILSVEKSLGVPLPIACKHFFGSTKNLGLDGFSIGLENVFQHSAVIDGQPLETKTICIAEYWLEADGDQVLVAQSPQPPDDPPVYYYAHSARENKTRKLAPSFIGWIESLPRSPVFRK
jgi:hypothetical protein